MTPYTLLQEIDYFPKAWAESLKPHGIISSGEFLGMHCIACSQLSTLVSADESELEVVAEALLQQFTPELARMYRKPAPPQAYGAILPENTNQNMKPVSTDLGETNEQ